MIIKKLMILAVGEMKIRKNPQQEDGEMITKMNLPGGEIIIRKIPQDGEMIMIKNLQEEEEVGENLIRIVIVNGEEKNMIIITEIIEIIIIIIEISKEIEISQKIIMMEIKGGVIKKKFW